jgi:hypothetical protein
MVAEERAEAGAYELTSSLTPGFSQVLAISRNRSRLNGFPLPARAIHRAKAAVLLKATLTVR